MGQMRDVETALDVLTDALNHCRREDMRTPEVFGALDFLEPRASSKWPFEQFRKPLDSDNEAAIAYQVLLQENPPTIEKVKAVLEKHPWHANQWEARLQDVPVAERDLVLFMQAARWADDIRIRDRQHHRGSWHYINWPLSPKDNRRPYKPESPTQ